LKKYVHVIAAAFRSKKRRPGLEAPRVSSFAVDAAFTSLCTAPQARVPKQEQA
jgi:hypothetical protein